MKHIPIDDTNDELLELIDQLDDEDFVITKDGEPVARLTKYPGKFAKYIGSMKGEIKVHGDIINVRDRWVKGRQW